MWSMLWLLHLKILHQSHTLCRYLQFNLSCFIFGAGRCLIFFIILFGSVFYWIWFVFFSGSNHVPAAAHPVSVPSHEMTVPLMPYYSGAVPTTVARDFEQQPSLGIDCSQYEAPLQPSRTHRREVLTCDVCLQIFNSKSQASAHFQGIPHQKKCNQLSAYMQAGRFLLDLYGRRHTTTRRNTVTLQWTTWNT